MLHYTVLKEDLKWILELWEASAIRQSNLKSTTNVGRDVNKGDRPVAPTVTNS